MKRILTLLSCIICISISCTDNSYRGLYEIDGYMDEPQAKASLKFTISQEDMNNFFTEGLPMIDVKIDDKWYEGKFESNKNGFESTISFPCNKSKQIAAYIYLTNKIQTYSNAVSELSVMPNKTTEYTIKNFVKL